MLSVMMHISSIQFTGAESDEMKKPEPSAIAATETKMGKHTPSKAVFAF